MAVGKKDFKAKLFRTKRKRKSQFRYHDAMPVLGVPDVVVREAVHVHLEPTIVVEVHVRNEDNVRRTIQYTTRPIRTD